MIEKPDKVLRHVRGGFFKVEFGVRPAFDVFCKVSGDGCNFLRW